MGVSATKSGFPEVNVIETVDDMTLAPELLFVSDIAVAPHRLLLAEPVLVKAPVTVALTPPKLMD